MASINIDLPEPKDLSHHISKVTKARAASSIKQFYKYFSIPGIGQLAGGAFISIIVPFHLILFIIPIECR